MKTSGIYQIQSIIKPEKIYIGSAKNIDRRRKEHFRALRRGGHDNPKLQSHYNMYGESDLIFSLLLGCDECDLLKVEQYFIDTYNPWFNICKNATNCIGRVFSDETIDKMKKSHLGQIPWNKGMKNPYSKETTEQISKSLKEYFKTDEGLKAIEASVERNKNYKASKETLEKRSNSMKGKNTWAKNFPSPMKGKKLSQETIDKRTATFKKNREIKKQLLKTQ